MKTRLSCFRFMILAALLTVILNVEVYPQGTDSRRVIKNKDKLFVGLAVTPQKTNIINEGFSTNLTYTKGNSINIAIEGAYFFSKFVGIDFGAGISPYSTQISLADYSVEYDTLDNDTEPEEYTMKIDGHSITETQKISFLSIPVRLALRFPAGERFGFFLNTGISAEIPVVKTYNGEGTFTYDGYYAQYPVTLHNVPDYGFPSDYKTNVSDEELEVKSFTAALTASGGFYLYLGTSFQLALGVTFNKSLTGVSGYEKNTDFRITSVADELNSIMGGSTKTGVQAFGISLGFRYYIQ